MKSCKCVKSIEKNIYKLLQEENKKRDILMKDGAGKKELEAIDKIIDGLVEGFIDKVGKG